MAKFRVGFIGTGRSRRSRPDGLRDGLPARPSLRRAGRDVRDGRLRRHRRGERQGVRREVRHRRRLLDYREMLAKEKLDLVSICTWPKLHAEMAIASAQAGCGPATARSPWTSPTATRAPCSRSPPVRHEVTFNHQRRYGQPFRKTKELIETGEIGPIVAHGGRRSATSTTAAPTGWTCSTTSTTRPPPNGSSAA